jgi:YceG-like family
MAALYPAHTDYLYFVARNDGTHIFSRTLREHERAIEIVRRLKSHADPGKVSIAARKGAAAPPAPDK